MRVLKAEVVKDNRIAYSFEYDEGKKRLRILRFYETDKEGIPGFPDIIEMDEETMEKLIDFFEDNRLNVKSRITYREEK